MKADTIYCSEFFRAIFEVLLPGCIGSKRTVPFTLDGPHDMTSMYRSCGCGRVFVLCHVDERVRGRGPSYLVFVHQPPSTFTYTVHFVEERRPNLVFFCRRLVGLLHAREDHDQLWCASGFFLFLASEETLASFCLQKYAQLCFLFL